MMKTRFILEIQRGSSGTFDRILKFIDGEKDATHPMPNGWSKTTNKFLVKLCIWFEKLFKNKLIGI
jgi:hypothetical protein